MASSKTKSPYVIQIALGFILIAGIFWFYWPILVMLSNALIDNEDYSFGLLLPFVSAYLIYLKWPQIRQRLWQPSWLGLLIIFLGFGLYIFGDLVAVLYLGPISFLVVITGLVVLLGGWGLFRLLWFPLFLLYFMVPLPAMVIKNLTIPLQLISSWLAAGLLRTMGVPLIRQGNVIDMGVRQLQVVQACSGLRYIFSLSALAMIYCNFYQRRAWKVTLLLISVVPAAILANTFRIAAMGLFPALQEGFPHVFSGWLIFVFCFVCLALFNKLLNYLEPPKSASEGEEIPSFEAPLRGSRPSYAPYLITALLLVIVSTQLAVRLGRATPVPLVHNFNNFPMQLGPWQGKRGFLDAEMAKVVGADDYLEANFRNPGHGDVSVWIAFFESQQKGLDKRLHSPLHCLVGGGWNIIESKIVYLAPGHPVRYLLMEQAGVRQVVYFWYLQRGRWLASEYDRYFFMGFDGLLKHRNDGAIVRLISPALPDATAAQERLTAFVRLLDPVLSQFIPQ